LTAIVDLPTPPFNIQTETARGLPSICTELYEVFGLFVLFVLFVLFEPLILFDSINPFDLILWQIDKIVQIVYYLYLVCCFRIVYYCESQPRNV